METKNIKIKKTANMQEYNKKYYKKNKNKACYALANLRKKAKRG